MGNAKSGDGSLNWGGEGGQYSFFILFYLQGTKNLKDKTPFSHRVPEKQEESNEQPAQPEKEKSVLTWAM